MSQHVIAETSDGVLTLTLNRPEKKNALTREMYQALGDAIDGAEFDKEVRCVLIQAEGDMFTAGNDLADFAAVVRAIEADPGVAEVRPSMAAGDPIDGLPNDFEDPSAAMLFKLTYC